MKKINKTRTKNEEISMGTSIKWEKNEFQKEC